MDKIITKSEAIKHMENGGLVYRKISIGRIFYKIEDGKLMTRSNECGNWHVDQTGGLRETDLIYRDEPNDKLNQQEFLSIPILSMAEFKEKIREAVREFVKQEARTFPQALMSDILKGCPEFDPQNIRPFFERWFLTIDGLPDNIAVEINKEMYWIISGDNVIIYSQKRET